MVRKIPFPKPMPAQPLWIERLPALLAQVTRPDAPAWWDRPAIERLFGLRRRQAIALLGKMGARRIGTGFAIERTTLLRFLEHPHRRNAFRDDQAHAVRVAGQLAIAQRDLAGRAIPIPTAFDPERIDFAGLPAGIELQRHQLTVSFETPTELLEKLFALGKALMNDYDTFEAALRP